MSEKKATSRLSGLIAPKGTAPRPVEMPQRAAVPELVARSEPAAVARSSMGVKSLTLRLADDEYERLRGFAFRNRMTHQDVLALALGEYLQRNE